VEGVVFLLGGVGFGWDGMGWDGIVLEVGIGEGFEFGPGLF